MTEKFKFSKQVDMLLVLGFCEGKNRRSVEEYTRKLCDGVTPIEKYFPIMKDRLEKQEVFQ